MLMTLELSRLASPTRGLRVLAPPELPRLASPIRGLCQLASPSSPDSRHRPGGYAYSRLSSSPDSCRQPGGCACSSLPAPPTRLPDSGAIRARASRLPRPALSSGRTCVTGLDPAKCTTAPSTQLAHAATRSRAQTRTALPGNLRLGASTSQAGDQVARTPKG